MLAAELVVDWEASTALSRKQQVHKLSTSATDLVTRVRSIVRANFATCSTVRRVWNVVLGEYLLGGEHAC
jgi:hypothetical protein